MASAIKQSAPKAIFFIHNPKAGGTSLRNLLISNYEPGAVSPTFFNAPMDYRLNKDKLSQFRGYQFYAGHYGFQTYLALREGHELITNFRSPISRIVSLYNYWRNEVPPSTLEVVHKDDAQCVFEAKEKSFSEFIRSPNKNLELYIENAHFRQLYRSNWEEDVGKFGAMQLVKWRIAHLYWFLIVDSLSYP